MLESDPEMWTREEEKIENQPCQGEIPTHSAVTKNQGPFH